MHGKVTTVQRFERIRLVRLECQLGALLMTFDTDTLAALSSFQEARGLPAGTAVDAPTWLALASAGDAAAPTGCVRLIFGYDSEWWQAGDPAVRLTVDGLTS